MKTEPMRMSYLEPETDEEETTALNDEAARHRIVGYVEIGELAKRLSVTVSVVRTLPEYEDLKRNCIVIKRRWYWTNEYAEAWLRGFAERAKAARTNAENKTPLVTLPSHAKSGRRISYTTAKKRCLKVS
jgi:hypothetical protein